MKQVGEFVQGLLGVWGKLGCEKGVDFVVD